MLGVTRSGYYGWQRQPLSDRVLADWLLTEQIRGIFDESEQTYFTVDGPDRLWVADFTQLTTWQGTAYIAVVADAYSRLCLGWSARASLPGKEYRSVRGFAPSAKPRASVVELGTWQKPPEERYAA